MLSLSVGRRYTEILWPRVYLDRDLVTKATTRVIGVESRTELIGIIDNRKERRTRC